MTAVSQSYPNYLGGLNEQPDELKKPGQLVEALNVIPDPTIGLTRRPGFRLIEQSIVNPGEIDIQPDPDGTWFEIELSNQINTDYIYFGNIRQDGQIVIFNQDGVKQAIRYTKNDVAIEPHKKYLYNNNELQVIDEKNNTTKIVETAQSSNNGYFRHTIENPLKYCVSKSHAIFTNPIEYPTLSGGQEASDAAKDKYYSFVSIKLIDTANYNYVFKVYGPENQDPVLDTYRYITDIEAIEIDNILDDYDTDTTIPLQVNGPFTFELEPANVPPGGSKENAVVKVTFVGQVVQLKSKDGDGFRNEARYTWSTSIVSPGKGFRKGEKYTITKDASELGGPADLDFTFEIKDVSTITEVANSDVRPNDPAVDITDLDATEIIRGLRNNFEANPNIDTATIVGNGIYLESSRGFSVSTTEVAVADVMNSQKLEDDVVPIVRVNTVAELPVECYAGFVVEVINSFDGTNNYFLKYIAESETVVENQVTKSDGFWEEIAKPYEPVSIRDGTLPHMITVARESDQNRFVFIVSPISYETRTAGTARDNPSMFEDNARITALNYYKNRLFMFTSNGTVISSRAGEINNLFLNTALRTSPIDPLDVVANSNQRVPIHGSSIVNNGMVLFGDSEQYMLTTNADLLTSETANVTKVANYTFDYRSSPIYLGANLGFVSSGVTRFYEMTNLYDRGPVDINERSQQIQSLFGGKFNMPVSSREQSQVVVYKSSENKSTSMMVYRFRQENSQESSQTSWVRWTVDRPVCYVSLPQDKMFVFVQSAENGCDIYRMDGSSLEGLPASGVSVVPKYTDGYTDTTDGVPFETIIKFPTIYAQSKDKMDISANLTIHRVKLSTAAIGTYNLKIERYGYDDYELLVEQTPADEYRSEFPTLYGEKIETVPIYTRNKNLTLTMSTNYDAPMTLQSMTWEGDYNRPYYKSV